MISGNGLEGRVFERDNIHLSKGFWFIWRQWQQTMRMTQLCLFSSEYDLIMTSLDSIARCSGHSHEQKDSWKFIFSFSFPLPFFFIGASIEVEKPRSQVSQRKRDSFILIKRPVNQTSTFGLCDSTRPLEVDGPLTQGEETALRGDHSASGDGDFKWDELSGKINRRTSARPSKQRRLLSGTLHLENPSATYLLYMSESDNMQ